MPPPTSTLYPAELEVALRAVHLSSLLTKDHFLRHRQSRSQSQQNDATGEGEGVSAQTKSDASEVTVADFASQAVIISAIHAAFPADVFIAEESAEMLRGSGTGLGSTAPSSSEVLRGKVWDLVCRARTLAREHDNHFGDTIKLPTDIYEMMDIIDLGQAGGGGVDDSAHKNGTGGSTITDGSSGSSRSGNTNEKHSSSEPQQASLTPRRTWVLDPIDGTKTYIRGQQYVVCLCLVEDGEQKLCVFGCPNLKLGTGDGDGEEEEKAQENASWSGSGSASRVRRTGRVRVEEGLVDLRRDGGWLIGSAKNEGVWLARIARPSVAVMLQDFLGEEKDADADEDAEGGVEGGGHDYNEERENGNENQALSSTVPASTPTTTMNTPDTSHPQDEESPDAASPPPRLKVPLQFTDSTPSPHVSPKLHRRIFQHFAAPTGTSNPPLDIWSMQLKYVLMTLRAAHADALIRVPPSPTYHAAVWDHAGGQLLLMESGGVLSDALGRPFLLDGRARKLVANWGVCSVRGGAFWAEEGQVVGGGGEGRRGRVRRVRVDGKTVHAGLLRRVSEEIRRREEGGGNCYE